MAEWKGDNRAAYSAARMAAELVVAKAEKWEKKKVAMKAVLWADRRVVL